jgi:hypothetical protein
MNFPDPKGEGLNLLHKLKSLALISSNFIDLLEMASFRKFLAKPKRPLSVDFLPFINMASMTVMGREQTVACGSSRPIPVRRD